MWKPSPRGELKPEKQDDSLTCYAPRLTKAMGLIDWEKDAVSIERLIRGLNSWPSAYTYYRGKTLKIWEADVVSESCGGEADSEVKIPEKEAGRAGKIPGSIVNVERDFFDIATGGGLLRVKCVQLEGKKRMSVKDFLLGYEVKPGLTL